MKRMTKKSFVLNGGHFCPICYEQDTVNIEDSFQYLQESRRCLNCKTEWLEIHKVTGYKITKKGDHNG